eukprot:9399091-Pyramimonas_sp.AAC.1
MESKTGLPEGLLLAHAVARRQPGALRLRLRLPGARRRAASCIEVPDRDEGAHAVVSFRPGAMQLPGLLDLAAVTRGDL